MYIMVVALEACLFGSAPPDLRLRWLTRRSLFAIVINVEISSNGPAFAFGSVLLMVDVPLNLQIGGALVGSGMRYHWCGDRGLAMNSAWWLLPISGAMVLFLWLLMQVLIQDVWRRQLLLPPEYTEAFCSGSLLASWWRMVVCPSRMACDSVGG
ncbi:hypothetical protein BRADI_3g37225v3 [Brachypodium distachyon]|uniref:Uncharacterized protein n=1 Tax=Brachypodium distachyon TaxID=15368 RepID=A0A2K2D1R8_BRADI|nr:hypothetical protein BRADI_3g37225v3 [Brachypodium distachyon]